MGENIVKYNNKIIFSEFKSPLVKRLLNRIQKSIVVGSEYNHGNLNVTFEKKNPFPSVYFSNVIVYENAVVLMT